MKPAHLRWLALAMTCGDLLAIALLLLWWLS